MFRIAECAPAVKGLIATVNATGVLAGRLSVAGELNVPSLPTQLTL